MQVSLFFWNCIWYELPCSSDLTSLTDGGFSECWSGQVYQLRQTFSCPSSEDATVLPHSVETGLDYHALCVLRASVCGHACSPPLAPSSIPGAPSVHGLRK